ncbi:30S ribosomal protein S20 [Myxococcota bacterium]|jgi:small subunit ribosomal protein S20|nr:30S ribosomal protein S20 [Myxococcota bacterium]MBU1243047.1 30S ribosomal protein S20 [Myxococcota bacterium]MBU1410804.1 30S ribosomal protein S20 [Myxococcota bacterium]MBU1510099.1 30S ribosomal protein S20 [Myxococcota bacterium]PKN17625.1 MAG: 30S ribosomal protein S20 [Deltaproteobacteria bacterium HGW-Deltaproteobacteria-22]
MAHHRSAEKRHRQSVARAANNRYFMSTLKTFIKKARTGITTKDDSAQAMLRKATSFIQHVANKGVIHRNKASRLVSRLTKFYNKSL